MRCGTDRVEAAGIEDNMDCTESLETVALKDEERQRCEVWTRVMGYHRPVSSFNVGKQGEFAERICFREPPANG
jgi:anaerobic ribonucleoside-triphosphate reductase